MPESTGNVGAADPAGSDSAKGRIQRLSTRAREGFAQLFRRSAKSARDAAFRVLEDRGAAEDVVQDVFRRAMAGKHASTPERFNESYIVRAARNEAISKLRLRSHGPGVPLALDTIEGIPDPAPSPEAIAARVEERDILRHAIAELPPRCREVASLIAFEELTRSEVAERLGISLKAVEWQITKAYARLVSINIGNARSKTKQNGLGGGGGNVRLI